VPHSNAKQIMSDPKGSHLFVNLGASQARRRLKGFGHGVRKVQSAGRNQALIIHTATGQHLSELEAKFADVGFSSTERGLSDRMESLEDGVEPFQPRLAERSEQHEEKLRQKIEER
jgi:hypothetical protein